MLKALLRNKLGRSAAALASSGASNEDGGEPDAGPDPPPEAGLDPSAGAAADEDGAPVDTGAHAAFTAFEDPLTATIFERLAYLPPDLAWALLKAASKPLNDDSPFPAHPPDTAPSWDFWPGLKAGPRAPHKKRVEPDVLVSWGDSRLLIEAKHRGLQDPVGQWVEQIDAVRASPRHAGARLYFLAVGGVVPLGGDELERLRERLGGDVPPLFTLHWEELCDVLSRQCEEGAAPPASALMRDMVQALERWGYRRMKWLTSLPNGTGDGRSQFDQAAAVLRNWRIQ
ncbi:MAG: hypothetical protein R3F14_13515 [Polyangiaceae bacterium]